MIEILDVKDVKKYKLYLRVDNSSNYFYSYFIPCNIEYKKNFFFPDEHYYDMEVMEEGKLKHILIHEKVFEITGMKIYEI